MIISAKGQSIEFWNEDQFKNFKKPAIALSGGADSALLLYFLAQQNVNTIHPYFLHRYDGENFLGPAKSVIEFMQNLYPNKIADLELKDITGREWSIIKTNFEMTTYMEEKNQCDIFLTGSTANPPYSAFKDNSGKRINERDRYRNVLFKKEEVSKDRMYYRPFSNVDKRFIAELYYKYDLINSLFPLTLSCIETTDTKHCKQCWWCKERFWAFGRYD